MQSSLEPHRRYYRQEILESEGNEPATRYFVRIEIDSLRNDMTEQISRLQCDMITRNSGLQIDMIERISRLQCNLIEQISDLRTDVSTGFSRTHTRFSGLRTGTSTRRARTDVNAGSDRSQYSLEEMSADIDKSIASMKRWIAGTGFAVAVVVLLIIGALLGSGVFLANLVLISIGTVGALVAVSSAPFA